MEINKKIIDVNIEVGDIIYQSVAGLCIWGKDYDVQNGVAVSVIPNIKKYENVLVPLRYLGNNIFEEELTHKLILCFRSDTIYNDNAKCTMDGYGEKNISCDLDYESYLNNEFLYPTQQYKKNINDFEERLKIIKEYCEKYDITFCIDSSTLGATYIIDSESQEKYDKISIQEKKEILKNIYNFSKKYATEMSSLISDSLNNIINEQKKLK